MNQNSEVNSAARFPTTRWTVVVQSSGKGDHARIALEELCETYWRPVYIYFRRLGESELDAQDMTQGFFLDFLNRPSRAGADPERGRFRTFLRVAAKRYRAKWHRYRAAAKRAPKSPIRWLEIEGVEHLALAGQKQNRSPDLIFEQQYARELVNRAFRELENHYHETGRLALFESIRGRLESANNAKYADVAATLGMTEASVKAAAHRMRKRFARTLRDLVGETVLAGENVEEEINYLLSVLQR